VTKTFCDVDVLFRDVLDGDVLSRRRFVYVRQKLRVNKEYYRKREVSCKIQNYSGPLCILKKITAQI
jgi:hypothetical protein